jgi:N-acetylneuraminic acid mutarotase
LKIVIVIPRLAFFILIGVYCTISTGQISYEILKPCPEKISNLAVAGITIFGRPYVYVFSGIDSTKNYSGIHARCYKYDLIDDDWTVLPLLPGGQDRIAAGASTIKDKIYILGGYEVFEDGNEVSLNQLHIFDPISDTFLEDGAPIPTPIDDQVQVVYKDSLLYSVTGWSNNGNVNKVWMYNPIEDIWSSCTPLPLGPIFSSFGSSGSIVGDTIYFIGGATEIGPFNLSDRFRKGYINPEDPTEQMML